MVLGKSRPCHADYLHRHKIFEKEIKQKAALLRLLFILLYYLAASTASLIDGTVDCFAWASTFAALLAP